MSGQAGQPEGADLPLPRLVVQHQRRPGHSVKDRDSGAYPPVFERQDHGLSRIPRLTNYRGFLFASLNPDVPELDEHLGAARTCIDMLADQAPEGLEVLRGQRRLHLRR